MASPVSFNQPASMPPQAFGAAPQQRPLFGAARDTVQFGATRDENRELLDGMRNRKRSEAPKKEKKGSVGKGASKSVKYGCGATALSFLTGLGLLCAAPFSIGLSAIPGVALMVGAPFVGFLGATVGFLKGKTVG